MTGRWLSKDPILLEGGLNLYVFCGNDPVNFTDPLGLSFWRSFGQGIVRGAIGAAVVVAGAAAIIAVGAPAAVVTGGLFVIGAVGGIMTVASVVADPSVDNIGYNLGAVSGGAIVGGMTGRALATKLSPPGQKPALGRQGWSLKRDLSQRWRYDYDLSFGQNWNNAMTTGPNCLSAAGAVAAGGSGLAQFGKTDTDFADVNNDK